MFYTFIQNNSGGSFRFDPSSGVTHYVIVEADSETEAMNYAESIGLYFDGDDCPCCGDRWYSPDAGTDIPKIYSEPVDTYRFAAAGFGKCIKGPECYVHLKDGSFKGYGE